MRRSPRKARSVLAALTACGLVAATGAGSASAQSAGVETLRFTTTNVTVSPVDLGPSGKSPGDLYVYAGDIKQRGRRAGSIYGSNTAIKIVGDREIVQGQLSYDFGGGHTIVVSGVSAYPRDGRDGFIRGETFGRVVVGGTGIYSGARGNVGTTRLPSGDYRHVVRLYP